MRKTLITTSIIAMIFGLTSCASKKEKQEIQKEVSEAKQIKGSNDLYSTEENILAENNNLSSDQKQRLKELLDRNYKDNQDIQTEIDKTKTVLFKELLSENGSRSKIKILENQILRLNKKKTRYSLSAYKEAKNIVGKNEVPLEKTLNMLDNRTIHEF
jgi:uncharacterized protein YcbK (DUF882 family)